MSRIAKHFGPNLYRDFVSGSLRTRNEYTLAGDYGFVQSRVLISGILIQGIAGDLYTGGGIVYGLNQMLIPGGERMCRLDSERC